MKNLLFESEKFRKLTVKCCPSFLMLLFSLILTYVYACVIMFIGGDFVYNTNVTNFRKDIYNILEQTIKFNEPVSVNTKTGNAIILSEEDYNGLMETLYLSSIQGMKESIIEGLNASLSECISESQVEW